jgi:hypothetical protein
MAPTVEDNNIITYNHADSKKACTMRGDQPIFEM